MIIVQCTNCSKDRTFACKAEYVRRSKTSMCVSCYRASIKGDKHPRWKGGEYTKDGYKFIWCPNHPFANASGYVREHRLIVEKELGRYLEKHEVVHHLNEVRDDNSPNNLEVTNQTNHVKRYHCRVKKNCTICGTPQLARGYCKSHYWTEYLRDYRRSI